MLYFARWKVVLISLVVLAGFLFTLPNFFSEDTLKSWPRWLPRNHLVLGLDLQGGAYLLYEVDRTKFVEQRLLTLKGDIRNALRRTRPRIDLTRAPQVLPDNTGVRVRLQNAADMEEAKKRVQPLLNPMSTGVLGGFGGQPIEEFDLVDINPTSFKLVFSEEGLAERIRGIVAQSIEVIRRRVDELGVTEPSIQRQGDDRILIEAPGVNPERLEEIIGKTAKLTFHLLCEQMTVTQARATAPPPGCVIVEPYTKNDDPELIQETPMLSGDDLDDAQPGFDQQTNEPLVTFRFKLGGATKFGQITQENVNRRFAIVLDNKVISAPVIREPILGGSGQISGNFTVESANDLSVLLRAGALPAELKRLHKSSVGPGLGADSVAAGRTASIIALLAVLVFMVGAYAIFGVFANVALLANVVLVFGALSALQATLTLPGIAGIVLTIGMAVDANVLIFERIREEARLGRSPLNAIDAGFARALTTILDANITTFIAAVILFSLGSGPIKGFAVTLAIGIFTTIFTAFTFSRLLIALWVRWRRPSALQI